MVAFSAGVSVFSSLLLAAVAAVVGSSQSFTLLSLEQVTKRSF
jgi:hypothetical protein